MSLNAADLQYLCVLVRQRSAIVLDGKAYLFEARLGSLARREGFSSLDALVTHLRAGAADGLHEKVVESMTINETSFFRDLHPFEHLRTEVLPELMRARAAERRLNIWCAACSTGQEPYSVAMLIREHFPALTGWAVRILAADLSPDSLERARQGRYSQMEINRGLPARLLVKYFQKHGAEWRIKDEVRRMVEFRRANLIDPWPALPPQDVILLRNVLIYFDEATKKAILGKVRRLLRPDGRLFLGAAETTFNLDDGFERVQAGRTACYRPAQ
ncbi:MAG TPA: protein-glutamate O-methyltransferase CheR [Gemmataceae bacterium]|nr:protein-glutamate O-methyltransferase CheR [Gemmataceae bacterium]